jgi:hypothetical protein
MLTLTLLFMMGAAPGPGRPDTSRPGPWDNDLLVYRVAAGGEVTKGATFPRGGVATVARLKDGRLIAAHQHFPENDPENFDKVAARFSYDDGKRWSGAEVIRLDGLPQGMRFPFDPTLVPLPDGRVRLYFTSLRGRRFAEDRPAIYSAISSNGIDYVVEPGKRFGIDGRPVIDCAVALHKGVFHLFAPDNGADPRGAPPGGAYHAVSKDALTFVRTNDLRMEGRKRWLGNAQSDGEQITFFGTADDARSSLWMATSIDGYEWTLVESPILKGADPGAVRARDGALIVIATGPPRPGTPSANRRPPHSPK